MLWNGLPFVAEHSFGYQRLDTYWLSATQGVFYVIAAGFAGRITRAAERHLSPRSLLGLVLLVQGLFAPLILIQASPLVVWIIACTVSATSALQWPIIESYVTAGRTGRAMRSAIGWWNIVWMSATLISLALTGIIISRLGAQVAIGLLAPVNLLALALLAFIRHAPGEHHHDPGDPVPASYRAQLSAARILLPLSYVIVAALSPLMPFLTGPLGLDGSIATVVASTWLGGRLVAAVVLWRTHGWHGRWWTLFLAGGLIAGGFGTAVLATSTPLLILGLGAFGIGQGIIYYAAIYYAMAVGNAEVDAAGTHEALIGLGYFIGPGIGLLTTLASDNDLGRNQLFVIAIWGLMGLAAIPTTRLWMKNPG
jgi:Major Facilitator Superfamily